MVVWYVWVAIQIALFVLAELLRPKPELENAKPESLQFPTATEDRPIPLAWGTVRQRGPNVVWYGDVFQEPITEEIKTGLFSSENVIKGFKYHAGVQFALCRGSINALRRIWVGDTEVYSATSILSIAITLQGTGYFRNEILTVSGGTFTRAATVRVRSVGALGEVLLIAMEDRGDYTTFPGGAVALSGGSGSGAQGTTTLGSEITHGQQVTVDCPDLFGGDEVGQGGVRGTLTLFAGTDTQSASPYLSSNLLLTAAPSAGGSGYVVGEILQISGGTFTTPARVRVATLSGSAVATVVVIDPGFYTAFPSSPASTTSTTGVGTGCTLTFTPNTGFQSVSGIVPRYLRTAYLAPSVDPIYFGNSPSIKPWAFEIRRIPNPLGLGDPTVNGLDANPANVLVEILTNTEWGLKQSLSSVDTSNFSTHATTLKNEGNGFSMLLDTFIQAADLIRLVEEQVDGVVFFNQSVGKWQMNLVRGGYDINALPLLSESNVVSLEDYARGSWEDTTNQVAVKFEDRLDQYKQTSALAHDQANVDVLQGRVVSAEPNYPGVKNRTLANSLAWRDLRGLSYPLAKATIIVDRAGFSFQPGQVVAWTYDVGGESFVRMPVRIVEIDYGDMTDGRIRLTLVEDVFQTAAGSFSDPGDTSWRPPVDDLQPFDYQVALEAPRALTLRDPGGGGPNQDKLWAAARRKGPEVGFRLAERHAAGSPSGPYADAGTAYGLMLVGRLTSALSRGSSVPLTSLVISPGPDAQAALETAFPDLPDAVALGTDLLTLCLVGTEFMLVTSAQTSGGNVQLNGVYRGALDSVQGSWPAGELVYLLFRGGVISTDAVPAGQNVDVKLLPFSATDQLADSAGTAVSFTMANRVRRPYPPSRISLDGAAWSSSTSMEANGSGPESFAIDVSEIRRRDYRTVDEVQALTGDAPSFFPDFPTANTTVHKIDVRNNPSGANTLLFTTATFSGTQKDVRRIEILKATDGVLPTSMRFDTFARHTHESVAYDSRDPLRHDFSVTTALTGQFNFGARLANVSSSTYTANAAGTHAFTLSSAFTAGNVEYNLNGAGFLTLILAGATMGNILGVAVSDTIVLRHTSTDSAALKQLDMNAPGAGTDGYMILHTP